MVCVFYIWAIIIGFLLLSLCVQYLADYDNEIMTSNDDQPSSKNHFSNIWAENKPESEETSFFQKNTKNVKN